jgi:membrane protein YdbS with pleckstrin-like domain
MARLPRSHPGIPYELDRYLTPAEKIVFRTRLHWVRILRPWLLFFIVLLFTGLLGSKLTGRQDNVNGILFLVVLGFLFFALWRTYEWYREWFIGTDRRLMLTLGVITRKIAMIPLGKVTDMRYDRPPIGQILGYGSFVLESAGQEQAFREVNYVPNPDVLYRRISEEPFTPNARATSDRPPPVAKAIPVNEPGDPWWKRA